MACSHVIVDPRLNDGFMKISLLARAKHLDHIDKSHLAKGIYGQYPVKRLLFMQ